MPLTIFKSSAGSGKTYTLSKEYLKLSLRAPDYYQKILAVTFTNKAAEEMKERVLAFLIAISKGTHELIPLYAAELKLSEEEVQMRAKTSLTHILHHYSFFSVMTIDTFFHRVIRSFSREIGLQGNFGIEIDKKKVTEIIANELYEGVDEDQKLKDWLVAFSMDRLRDGKGYEFKNEIIELADQLFSEAFKKISSLYLHDPELKLKIVQLQDKLFKNKVNYEKKLKNYGKVFFDLLADSGLQEEDLKGGSKKTIPNFFHRLIKKDLKEGINKTMEACLESADAWTKIASPKKELIIQAAENHFIPLLKETVSFIQENERSYQTTLAVLRNLFTLGLLSDLSQRLQNYKQEEEVIMISDLPDFLNQIINDSDTPFIYEKVGSRYHHFFIDEFQDTSVFQWRNFKPLIQESLASGHENIIVGDAKQSIYRWRGADTSLLVSGVEKEIPDLLVDDTNQVNYRSARNIIAFNNAVFSRLPALIGELAGDNFSEAEAQQLKAAYDNVKQQVADQNKNNDGQVQVEFLALEGEKFTHVAMQRMVQIIKDLRQQGHSSNDIAILVRTNGEAEQIVNFILQYNQTENSNLEVISAEGMLLKNSRVVRLLLTTFRYLLNKGDKVVEKDLIYQYQQVVLGRKIMKHEDFVGLDPSKLPDKFTKHQQHLLHLPIFELVEVMIRLFKLNELEEEYAYLQAFQDVILEFGKNKRSDLRLFLEWWADEEDKRSVHLTGSHNAIEIITFHKSKGLQYPIVIIPFCTFKMDSNAHISWYASPVEDPFHLVKQVPVSYSSSLSKTHFDETYRQELASCYLESLDILYVAFTRAEQGLFVLADQPAKNKQNWTTDVGKILWKFFEEAKMDGWGQGVYQVGSLKVRQQKKLSNVVRLKHYPSYKWSDRITIRKTRKFEEVAMIKRNEGILLHQILSEIVHFKDTSRILDRYEYRMEITKEDRQRYEQLIMSLWNDDKIKKWFNGEGEVKTEVVVLPSNGEVKRMDRVIVNGGQATVIDFKSGETKSGDEKQLIEYVKLLEEMGYEAEGYLLYLETRKLVRR